jgi:hypothetical protein
MDKKAAIKGAIQSFKELEALRDKERELQRQLYRCLLLLDTFGADLFKHGAIKTRVTGNPHGALTMVVTMGNGETEELPLEDVPLELWPIDVVAEQRGRTTKYGRILKEARKCATKN